MYPSITPIRKRPLSHLKAPENFKKELPAIAIAKNEHINSEQSSTEGQLAVDVYQTSTEIIILAPIAGVKLSDLNVSITEDVLSIKGKRCLEFDVPEQDYLTQECFWGDFSRAIVLPASV